VAAVGLCRHRPGVAGPLGLHRQRFDWLERGRGLTRALVEHLALANFPASRPASRSSQWAGTPIAGDSGAGVPSFLTGDSCCLSFVCFDFLQERPDAHRLLVLIATSAHALAGGRISTDDGRSSAGIVLDVGGCGWLAEHCRQMDYAGLGSGRVAMGLGLLFKQSAIYQIICWASSLGCSPPPALICRKPGPWLALLLSGLGFLPSIIWNARNGWARCIFSAPMPD